MHARKSSVLLLFLFVSGCALGDQSGEPIQLSDSTDQKADSVDGKTLEPVITAEVELEPGVHQRQLEITRATANWVTVEAERLVVPAGKDRKIKFSVDTVGWDVFTDLRFVLAYRLPDLETSWTTVELEGTFTSIFGGSKPITINNFHEVELDPVEGKMSLELDDTYTVPFSGFRGKNVEYSLFVFPHSGWGSLVGQYDYEVTIE